MRGALASLTSSSHSTAARSPGCHLQSERTTANNPNSAERTLTRVQRFSIICEMTQLRSNNIYEILADATILMVREDCSTWAKQVPGAKQARRNLNGVLGDVTQALRATEANLIFWLEALRYSNCL